MICKIIKKNSPEHSIESEQRGHTGMDTGVLVYLEGEDQAGHLYCFSLLRKIGGNGAPG